jgi:hypothetical protein
MAAEYAVVPCCLDFQMLVAGFRDAAAQRVHCRGLAGSSNVVKLTFCREQMICPVL